MAAAPFAILAAAHGPEAAAAPPEGAAAPLKGAAPPEGAAAPLKGAAPPKGAAAPLKGAAPAAARPSPQRSAPAPGSADPAVTPRAAHFRLANGLEVVLEEDHRQPQVAIVVAYEIGDRDEPAGYAELAHLVEHLTYRGSRHLGPLESLSLLDRVGAHDMNGFTARDYTAYYAHLPAAALPLALWIESERMAFTLESFNEHSFALEKKIVRNEMLMRAGPARVFHHHTMRAVFGEDHPYSRSKTPLGDIDALELRHAQWFFQQGYRPSNARLILVGDFATHAARALVERYFGPVVDPPVPFSRATTAPPPFATAARVTVKGHVFREELSMLWSAPPPSSSEHTAAHLLASRLERFLESELVDQVPILTEVSMTLLEYDLGSFFSLSATLRAGVTHEEAERAIEQELLRAWSMDFDAVLPEEKEMTIIFELVGLEDPLSRALSHLEWLRWRKRPFDVQRRIAEVRAVTADDVRSLRRYFVAERSLVAWLVDAAPGESIPAWGRVEVEGR